MDPGLMRSINLLTRQIEIGNNVSRRLTESTERLIESIERSNATTARLVDAVMLLLGKLADTKDEVTR